MVQSRYFEHLRSMNCADVFVALAGLSPTKCIPPAGGACFSSGEILLDALALEMGAAAGSTGTAGFPDRLGWTAAVRAGRR
jgi:hypothetical protein